jgi:twinkle protein
MAGVCIDKIGHSCGTRRGLQVFLQEDGSIDGYCFNCKKVVKDPYGDKPEGWEPPKPDPNREQYLRDEIAEIQTYPVMDIAERRLRKDVLEHFGVKIGLSEQDGKTPSVVYLPYTEKGEIVRYKARILGEKKMWNISLSKDVDLFGWEQAIASGARRLIITEGEYDAISLTKILEIYTKQDYKDYMPAVVSLPNGAGTAKKDLARLAPKIRKHFKEVSLCFDNDEAGEQAVKDVLTILPEATAIVLPAKDANECLMKGKGKAAFTSATFRAEKPKNTRLVWGEDIHEEAKKPAEWGVPWPWDKVTELTRGIRLGETIYLGAAQKLGKSEIVNTLGAHLIKTQGWKVMMAKPEEANAKTYKLVAGKMMGKVFHDPKVEFDDAAYDKAGEILRGKLCMVNLYQHLGWETLKTDIRAASAAGCKAIFIDPITNLTNGMNAADANTKLQEIAQELSAMALDLNVVIFIFCHLRNPDSGLPHDRGGEVLTSQFAGSRAMGRSCNYMFGLQGNKDPNLSREERNQRQLVLLDDREFGEVGVTNLYWDHKSTLFNQM